MSIKTRPWRLTEVIEMPRGMTDDEVRTFLVTGELPDDSIAPIAEPTELEVDDDEIVLGEGDALALLAGVPIGAFVAADDHWKRQLRAPKGTPIGGQWVDEIGGLIRWKWTASDKKTKGAKIYKKHGDGDIVTVRSDGGAVMRWDSGTQRYLVDERQSDGSWKRTAAHNKKAAYERVMRSEEEWREPKVAPLGEGDSEDDGFVESKQTGETPKVSKSEEPKPETSKPEVTLFDQILERAIENGSLNNDDVDAQDRLFGLLSKEVDEDVNPWVFEYVQTSMNTNGELREGVELSPMVHNIVDGVDRAIENSRLLDDIVTFRGVGNVGQVFGDAWPGDGDATGLTFRDKGFVSTSFVSGIASDFATEGLDPTDFDTEGLDPVVFRVALPKGVSTLGIPADEGEVLLPRDVTFRVIRDNGLTGPNGSRLLDVIPDIAFDVPELPESLTRVPEPLPPVEPVELSDTRVSREMVVNYLNSDRLTSGDVIAQRADNFGTFRMVVVDESGTLQLQRRNDTTGEWRPERSYTNREETLAFLTRDIMDWRATDALNVPEPEPTTQPNSTPVPEATHGLRSVTPTKAVYRAKITDGEIVAMNGAGDERVRWDQNRKKFVFESMTAPGTWSESTALNKKNTYNRLKNEEWYEPGTVSPETTDTVQDAPSSARRPGRDLSTEIGVEPTSITPRAGHRDSRLAGLVAEQSGWNDPAQVVSKNELDDAVAAGWVEIFRGIDAKNDVEAQKRSKATRTGKWFMGNGIYGNGVYTSTNATTARSYAGYWPQPSGVRDEHGFITELKNDPFNTDDPKWVNGEWTGEYSPRRGSVIRMALDPTARIITWDDLQAERDRWLEENNIGHSFWLDSGRYAALRGYDAIHVIGTDKDDGGPYNAVGGESPSQYIVLNRSVLMMEENDVS